MGDEHKHTFRKNDALKTELADILLKADTIILTTKEEVLLNLLNQITLSTTQNYGYELERLYLLDGQKNIVNNELSRLIKKQYAYNLYHNRNYTESIRVFGQYFNEFEPTEYNNLIHERIAYANCHLKLKEEKTYVALIEKGIDSCKQDATSYLNKSRYQIELSKFLLSKTQIDSADHYIRLALESYQLSEMIDYSILAKIYHQQSRIELNLNLSELSLEHADLAINYVLKTDPTDLELASFYKEKALALFFNFRITTAIEYFKMTARIYEEEAPESNTLATVYRYIGWAYFQSEDYEMALNYFNQSIDIRTGLSNYIAYRQLADTYFALDSIDLAIDNYKNVLKYLKSQTKPNQYQIAVTKIDYGRLLVEKNINPELGVTLLSESIETYYQIFGNNNHNLLYPLNLLGTHFILTGEIDRGLDTLQSALICSSNNFKPQSFYENPDYTILDNNVNSNNTLAWKAHGLYQRYLKTNTFKDLEASLNTYSFYIYCSSENRKYFDKSSSIVSSKQIHYVYNEAIDVAYLLYKKTNDPKYINDIFRFTEGKKSFTLFQSLKILENKKLLDIPESLLNLEQDLKQKLSLYTERIIDQKKSNSGKTHIDSLETIVFSLHQKLDSIQKIFKQNYSGFYNLKYGFEELDLHEAQKRTPKETDFINYSLTDTLVHIIHFSKDTVRLYTEKIDSSFFQQIERMVNLLKKVNTDNSYDEFNAFTESSYFLYQKLIAPFIDHITNKKIIFIPDGEINYISFDALILDSMILDRPDYRRLNYLIKHFKTNVANSMQIYFNMKKRSRKPNDQVYAFAPFYPLFPNTDSLPEVYRNLRPLDYAGTEVKAISRIMSTIDFEGKEATKINFQKNAKKAGILHLAMHTIINDEEPLHSKLLFTHEDRSQSSMLNTFELLSLELNAELAVLSGCSTGEGKLQKGEGVMSLSSGFQYAGVPAIVMSLWEVNDRFGSLVIQKFYENLAQGMDKKQSLYKAKVEVLGQGNALYAHPYYWAGLTLMGDDSKIAFIRRYQWDKIVIVFTPILFIIVLLFQMRKKWKIKRA
jgi:CHAT domain-containing protein